MARQHQERVLDWQKWYQEQHGEEEKFHTPLEDAPPPSNPALRTPPPQEGEDLVPALGEEFRRKVERAALDRRSAISLTTEQQSVNDDLISSNRTRKEAAEVRIPPKLPTVPGLSDWKIKVATALVQASAYGDQAEVAWFRECNDPDHDFEYFGDSWGDRYRGLDHKLATAVSAIADQHASFKRELDKYTRVLYKQDKLPTGRHMCYLLFHQLKLNDDLGTYYGIQDLVGVEWQGDAAPQVAKFRDRWMKVLENINPWGHVPGGDA